MHISIAFVNNALEVLIAKQCEKIRKPSANFQEITNTLNVQGTLFLKGN